MRFYALCLSLALSQTAAAGLITIEPDDYAAGTDLSHVAPGVTLSTFSGLPIYAVDKCQPDLANCKMAPTGSNSLGQSYGFAPRWTGPANILSPDYVAPGFRDNTLLVTFDQPTDYVSVLATFAYDAGVNGPFFMRGFDQQGNELAIDPARQFVQNLVWPNDGYTQAVSELSLTSLNPDIYYVLIGGGLGNIVLDRFQYSDVPEPGSMALLVAGISGLAASRRFRKSAAA